MTSISLLRSSFRSLLRRPWQTGLMVMGIALGVAVVVAIDLANASAGRAFELSSQALVGRATHQLVGGPAGIPDSLYTALRVEQGVRSSAPVVEGMVLAVGLERQPLRVLGVDPLVDAPFRDHFGLAGVDFVDLARFYTDRQAVFVSPDMADRYGWRVGTTVEVQVGAHLETVRIAGTIPPREGGSSAALDNVLVMDVAAAQELLGQVGRLTRIDLILGPDEADVLRGRLPEGVRLVPAGEQTQTLGQLTEAFQLNLTALSLLALVVGMFLIYNTVMFSVVQRRPVLGTMRALGLTGGQLFGLVLAETAVVAAIGAAAGLGLGWLLGRGAVTLVSQTINDLYYVLAVREAPLRMATAVKGIALGLGAGLAGALLPALEAASVPPVTAMARSSLEARARRWIPWVAGTGVALLGLGSLLLVWARSSILTSLLALAGVVVGLALMVPAATVVLMRMAGPVMRRAAGALGTMAARSVVRSLSRTGIAIAALTVSVSATIGVSAMITSFRSTVANWLDLVLRADVYVSAPGPSGAQWATNLPPDLVARLESVEGVAVVEPYRTVLVSSEFGEIQLTAVDGRRQRDAGLYRFARGTPEQIWAQVLDGAVIASEPLAYRAGLPPASASIRLETDRGPRTFPIAAVYYDYTAERGALIMTLETYHRYWDDVSLTSFGIFATPGQGLDDLAARMRRELGGTGLEVQVNRALRLEALRIFDRTFAITNALRLLAVVVAFIGMVSALMALQLERSRELATLQALGCTPGQLSRLTLMETGLMGTVSAVLSWPIGLALAAILVYVINLRSFGWSIRLQIEPGLFLQAVAIGLAAALLAAIYPLHRLTRAEVAAGLRQE